MDAHIPIAELFARSDAGWDAAARAHLTRCAECATLARLAGEVGRELVRSLPRPSDGAGCLSLEDAAAFAGGRLTGERLREALEHVGGCRDCLEELLESLRLREAVEKELEARARTLAAQDAAAPATLRAQLAALLESFGAGPGERARLWRSVRDLPRELRRVLVECLPLDLTPATVFTGSAPGRAPTPKIETESMVLPLPAPLDAVEFRVRLTEVAGRFCVVVQSGPVAHPPPALPVLAGRLRARRTDGTTAEFGPFRLQLRRGRGVLVGQDECEAAREDAARGASFRWTFENIP